MNHFKNDLILVVEDDPDDQHLFKQICKRLGVKNELVFCDNGIHALEYLSTTENSIFVILCDINMPLMDGLELKEKINQDINLKRKNIPFIVLSTAATTSQVNKAYELDVQGFFSKGTSYSEFEKDLSIILQYWARCKAYNHSELI
jgi:CheY-like chemotaxis protein